MEGYRGRKTARFSESALRFRNIDVFEQRVYNTNVKNIRTSKTYEALVQMHLLMRQSVL